MLGATDREQLAYAYSKGWVIVTHEKTDYQRLHQQLRRQSQLHAGIIIVPVSTAIQAELRVSLMLDWFARQPQQASTLHIWNDVQAWLNQGHRLPGYFEDEIAFAVGR